jgi:hypothetical protein
MAEDRSLKTLINQLLFFQNNLLYQYAYKAAFYYNKPRGYEWVASGVELLFCFHAFIVINYQ